MFPYCQDNKKHKLFHLMSPSNENIFIRLCYFWDSVFIHYTSDADCSLGYFSRLLLSSNPHHDQIQKKERWKITEITYSNRKSDEQILLYQVYKNVHDLHLVPLFNAKFLKSYHLHKLILHLNHKLPLGVGIVSVDCPQERRYPVSCSEIIWRKWINFVNYH